MVIVGLGNIGSKYANNRHNVGQWLLDNISCNESSLWKDESRISFSSIELENSKYILGKPNTYMNECGLPIRQYLNYYKISVEKLIIVHDELDLPCGEVRLKSHGGHGGHNGLRNIISHLGTNKFKRIRIGIGHPGNKNLVHSYVLSDPSKAEKQKIDNAIASIASLLSYICSDKWDVATNILHTKE